MIRPAPTEARNDDRIPCGSKWLLPLLGFRIRGGTGFVQGVAKAKGKRRIAQHMEGAILFCGCPARYDRLSGCLSQGARIGDRVAGNEGNHREIAPTRVTREPLRAFCPLVILDFCMNYC
jgi:hypothetical protein